MMSTLYEQEQTKYRDAFSEAWYRNKCHGLTAWHDYRDVFPRTIRSAVDLGTGTGRLVEAWLAEGIDGHGVDCVVEIAVDRVLQDAHPERYETAPLWDYHPGRVFDFGMSADVMEHIPDPKIDEVLACTAACCRVVFFQIANFRSEVKGHDLHPSQHPASWWRDRIASAMGGTLTTIPRRDRGSAEKHIFLWSAA